MTKKRSIILAAVAAVSLTYTLEAQVANCALQFGEGGSVDCGAVPELAEKASYTVQFWMNPTTWTPGATVISVGSNFGVALGNAEGAMTVNAGGKQLSISSADMKAGAWSQLTVVCDNGAATALVNGKAAGTGTLGAHTDKAATLKLGDGTYRGKLDEVRLWTAALKSDFNYFINNTLNTYAPQWGDLAVYYKMDYPKCSNVVDYVVLEKPEAEYNNHGVITGDVSHVSAADNAGLGYKINGAYTANERFFDRGIAREQYLLSNDLIILGIESMPDGHLRLIQPNNHAEVSGGVTYLDSFEGRRGVARFDGTGKLTAPTTAMQIDAQNGYTFEAWFNVDTWEEGAYIMRKENADGTRGFSVRLGAEGQLFVRCNGSNYGINLGCGEGEWHHIGISPRNTGTTRTTYLFVYDGTGKSATNSLCDSGATDCVPADLDKYPMVLGENFKGLLDDVAFWTRAYDASTVNSHYRSMPMPSLGCVLTADQMMIANSLYRFDKPETLGWDSYSQDEWRDIMVSAYDGYEGYKVRISVKSHNGWQTTISNAERRKIFAADLAECAKGYDGVELDLEWMDGTQTNLGHLAREIRAVLPAEQTLHISCHAYGAYMFPKGDMSLVDGFTFQQYGPQNTYFSWSNYTSSTSNFIKYGFAKDKIMTSYATTTSKGQNGSESSPVTGVRGGLFDLPGFKATDDSGTIGGFTYWYTGPDQTYRRAKYAVENGLQGIFYWDMGNDVPVSHPYNLAKWASYGLNANIQRIVDQVNVKHYDPTGIESAEVDTAAFRLEGRTLRVLDAKAGVGEIYNIAGCKVLQFSGSEADLSKLSAGAYIAKAGDKSIKIVLN